LKIPSRSLVKYAEFKQLILELEQALEKSPSIGESTEKLEELRKQFQQHVKERETVVFPSLRRSPLNLGELGKTLYRAKENLESDTAKAPVCQHGATLRRH